MTTENQGNCFPAVPNVCAIYQKSADFPTDRVVIQFAQATGTPALLQLVIRTGAGRMHNPPGIEVPAGASPDTLVSMLRQIPLPPGVVVHRGTGPDAGSALFVAPPGDVFLGLRTALIEPAKVGSVQPSDDPVQERGSAAYWGQGNLQPAFAL